MASLLTILRGFCLLIIVETLLPTSYRVQATAGTKLRSRPAHASASVAYLPFGEFVRASVHRGKWISVALREKHGWVPKRAVCLVPSPDSKILVDEFKEFEFDEMAARKIAIEIIIRALGRRNGRRSDLLCKIDFDQPYFRSVINIDCEGKKHKAIIIAFAEKRPGETIATVALRKRGDALERYGIGFSILSLSGALDADVYELRLESAFNDRCSF